MRVCIFVRNTFTVDARVLKQARSISRAGHETLVIALGSGDLPEHERRDGFEVRRVSPMLTWRDGFPRLTGAQPTSEEGSNDEGTEPRVAATAAAPHATAPVAERSNVLRWTVTGRGAPPRSWPGGSAGPADRVVFALRLAGRVPMQRSRRVLRKASRSSKRARVRLRRRVLRPTRFRQVERRMARAAIVFRPDVCWANDADTLRPAWAAARATGARLVYDAHEVIWDDRSLKPAWRLRWWLVEASHVRRASRVVTVCEPIADLMAKRYRIRRPVVVLNCPSATQTTASYAEERSPLREHARPGERIVLFHGSLSPHRGVEELIRAMPLLPRDVRLVVLGHGAHGSVLQALATESSAAERITFLPSVPAAELPAWLAGADIGTIPYLRIGRNHEFSTPNKLFEYMHLGIPVVVNDLPEVRRIVSEVGFGIVRDCSDPAQIAAAIEALLGEPARYAEMRANALAGAPRYTWEVEEPKLLAALDAHQNV